MPLSENCSLKTQTLALEKSPPTTGERVSIDVNEVFGFELALKADLRLPAEHVVIKGAIGRDTSPRFHETNISMLIGKKRRLEAVEVFVCSVLLEPIICSRGLSQDSNFLSLQCHVCAIQQLDQTLSVHRAPILRDLDTTRCHTTPDHIVFFLFPRYVFLV